MGLDYRHPEVENLGTVIAPAIVDGWHTGSVVVHFRIFQMSRGAAADLIDVGASGTARHLHTLGQPHKLALGIGKVILEEPGPVFLQSLSANERVAPFRSEANGVCNAVDEATLPASKLHGQLSFLLKSSGMESQQTSIARFGH